MIDGLFYNRRSRPTHRTKSVSLGGAAHRSLAREFLSSESAPVTVLHRSAVGRSNPIPCLGSGDPGVARATGHPCTLTVAERARSKPRESEFCPQGLTTSSSAADLQAAYLPIDFPRAAAIAFCCAKPAKTRQMGACPRPSLTAVPASASRDARFLWHRLRVTTEVIPHNDPNAPRPRELRYEQARVLGGGSSINGQLANRGSPADYDDWEARGATGWRWETVLPFFRKIERDIDFDGPLHGSEGYIPVSRVFPDNWSDHAKAVAEACKLAGFKYVADQNGEFEDGYYPLAISNLYDRRVSAAIGYLGTTVRQRDNLSILTDTEVCGVLFEDTCCVGIRAMVGRQETEFHGREVILCSGAIHSPAILLRSGIGPIAQLRDLGIPVRAHVPGVGQRLMDHPSISVASFLQPHARANPYNKHSHLLGMRFSSDLDRCPAWRYGNDDNHRVRGSDRRDHGLGQQDLL